MRSVIFQAWSWVKLKKNQIILLRNNSLEELLGKGNSNYFSGFELLIGYLPTKFEEKLINNRIVFFTKHFDI